MRFASALLLVLGACRPPSSADYVQDLLSRTPIPVAKLREVLRIQQGDLEILSEGVPDILDYPSTSPWRARNVSTRDLWIAREELAVLMDITPLLKAVGGCASVTEDPPQRPAFPAAEWIRISPGASVRLLLPAPYDYGKAEFFWSPGRIAEYLLWEAESFNDGYWTGLRNSNRKPCSFDLGSSWFLPAFEEIRQDEGAGSPLLGALLPITSLPAGPFDLSLDVDCAPPVHEPLRARVWVLTPSRQLVFHGDAQVLSHRSQATAAGSTRVDTRYAAPAGLPPGDYQVLFAANAVGPYFKRAHDMYAFYRGGCSNWFPLHIP